ncbi:MAG: hypothetical protein JNM63_03255 [Spirochaetia bacterium]|nr:hypothetical protein [Spirochaetia bacterium]
MSAELTTAVESAHAELWKRFIGDDGVILDYACPKQELPTREECELGKPNVIGWWSPIENGAFFNGLYLDAMCERFKITGRAEDKTKVQKIAEGLILLASISKVPGFIGRGVGLDGKCHYALGSDDQTHPWFYGLYRYLQSGIPSAPVRGVFLEKMIEVAGALERNGWRSPCDERFTGENRGDFSEGDFRAVVRYLFILRAMEVLTKDAKWGEKYRKALREKPKGSELDRKTICSKSCLHDLGHIPDIRTQMWIVAGAQGSLAELIRLEEDPETRKAFLEGLDKNSSVAAEGLALYREFPKEDTTPFRLQNWREAFPKWEAQPTQKDGQRFAEKQLQELDELDFSAGLKPRRWTEQHFMRQPLAAALMVALGGKVNAHQAEWENALSFYDYSKLHTSAFFFAECAYYRGIKTHST